jgi:hypothetical protein
MPKQVVDIHSLNGIIEMSGMSSLAETLDKVHMRSLREYVYDNLTYKPGDKPRTKSEMVRAIVEIVERTKANQNSNRRAQSHTLVFYAHAGADALSLRKRQEAEELVIAHGESHPLTYSLYRCDPATRAVAGTAPELPSMTLEEFKLLPKSEQDTYRVLYSNRAETLRLTTQEDNIKESAATRKDMANAHQLYRIHDYQKENSL